MGFVYNSAGVDELAKGKTPVAGNGQCVELIKKYVAGLQGVSASSWRAGEDVMKAGSRVQKGTAIASGFDKDGRYPNHTHGNHGAIVVRVMGSGIWVVDQWPGMLTVQMRLIRIPPPHLQYNQDGSYKDASNNALAFRVIEK